jgi:hypothetical protein
VLLVLYALDEGLVSFGLELLGAACLRIVSRVLGAALDESDVFCV